MHVNTKEIKVEEGETSFSIKLKFKVDQSKILSMHSVKIQSRLVSLKHNLPSKMKFIIVGEVYITGLKVLSL